MDSMSMNLDTADFGLPIATKPIKRVQCLAFRIMLPNLQGRRPQKDHAWTLACIRAIIQAKQIDDAICFRAGIQPRLRMSEFVYAWFSPPSYVLDDLMTEHREQAYARADEARWCLYYGAKVLSRECVEAKLFLVLLDEKNGDDEVKIYSS